MSDEAAPGTGPREERYRLAAMAAGVPLVLLDAPLVLSADGERSLLREALREPVAIPVLLFFLAWPVWVGGVSLAYGRRRKVPARGLFVVPALLYALASALLALAFTVVLANRPRAWDEPLVILGALTGWVAVYLLGRGFRRAGWERWMQLVAGAWLAHGAVESPMLFVDGPLAADQAAGAWIFLFAMACLAPLITWTLWPRRSEAPLRP